MEQLSLPEPNEVRCSKCARLIPPMLPGEFVSNYGVNRAGEKKCLSCCGDEIRGRLRTADKATLYLTTRTGIVPINCRNIPKGGITIPRGDFTIQDAFGEVKITPTGVRASRHNIARVCYTAWFTFEGREWIAKRYGDMTEIAHCKRLRGRKPKSPDNHWLP